MYTLLIYSIVQSPSWEANWFAASQEIPRISRNPKVHYRTHKRPLPVSILGHPNPVHIPTSHLLEIHPNIIHPFAPRSPHWSLSLLFPQQDPIHPPLLTHTRHMPHTWAIYVTTKKNVFAAACIKFRLATDQISRKYKISWKITQFYISVFRFAHTWQ